MSRLEKDPTRVLGFDVAKDSITVFDTLTAQVRIIANSRAAIDAALAGLDNADAENPCLAVCEPTGGYEILLLERLLAAGIACHRADTLKVKAFIRSFGTLAKTDVLDARALALYGRERWAGLALFAMADADQRALSALVARRCDLVGLKVAETNRAKTPARQAIRTSCQDMLRTIERQIGRIEAAIEALLRDCPALRRRVTVMQTLPGIGPRTATALAATMPELGQLCRRKAAALAGLAPHPRDSGTISGYRKMRGGRPNVRASLFMAALAASRADGPLRAFYKRLIENGKKPIVAIAAIMRKIIVILNARIRDDIKAQAA